MREDIEKKSKTCSACLNAGKNLKFQIPQTKKNKNRTPKTPGEEIQLDFTGSLHNKKLPSTPYILVAVDKNSRWPVTKICKNTNHETVITFLKEYINIYGVSKQIKSDKGGAFISKENKEFCKRQNIKYIYGTANLHTGTGLVERTIQSLENLVLTNLEDGLNLRESINRALYVLRFTKHSETKKTPFEIQFGRAPRTRLTNLKKCRFSGLKRPFSVHYPEHSRRDYRSPSNVQEEDGGAEIQTGNDLLPNQKTTDQYGKYKQIQLPIQIL